MLGALQDLALTYMRREHEAIPFWRMATVPIDELQARAEAVTAASSTGTVVETTAVPGGGTLPTVEIPSVGISLAGDQRERLRASATPIMARVVDDATILDLRTIDPSDDPLIIEALSTP